MADGDPILPVSLFPDVPNFPGVPQLARLPFVPPGVGQVLNASSTSLLASSTSILASFTGGSQLAALLGDTFDDALPTWGVFDSDGAQVIEPDSIVDFDYRKEYRISDFPIEQGNFASYNKVLVPFDAAVRMRQGGSLADRTQFLLDCETVVDSFDLYDILTPEKRYTTVNCVRMEVSRKGSEGAFVVEVDLFFRLIQQTSAQYSTSTPSAQYSTTDQSASSATSANPATPATATQVAPTLPPVNTSNAQSPAAQNAISNGVVSPQGTSPAGASGGSDAIVNAGGPGNSHRQLEILITGDASPRG